MHLLDMIYGPTCIEVLPGHGVEGFALLLEEFLQLALHLGQPANIVQYSAANIVQYSAANIVQSSAANIVQYSAANIVHCTVFSCQHCIQY